MISLRRWRRLWFWVKLLLVLVVLAIILPPAARWVRQLMYSAATRPPEDVDVVTGAGSTPGVPQGGLLSRIIEVLRDYYRGP